MFDTMSIAKRIKQARIDKNMTQLQLADAMGVSYQAVSNWERGNSMPDISKLADLCATLDLTVNELLGMEDKTANAVTKAMEKEELTVEELKEVAPMLPPEQVKEQVESKWVLHMPDMSFLKKMPEMIKGIVSKENMEQIQIAAEAVRETFDEETVEQLKAMRNVKVVISNDKETPQKEQAKSGAEKKKRKKKIDLASIAELAPFLDEEYLNNLVLEADLGDLDGLEELAPFLSKETLNTIAMRADVDDLDVLVEIAPFLEKQTIANLIERCMEEDEGDMIEEFAPFAEQATLDGIVNTLMERNADIDDLDWDVTDLYPFLGKATLLKLAKYLLEQGQADQLDDVKDYL